MEWIFFGLAAGLILGFHDFWMKASLISNPTTSVVFWSTLFGALCWAPFILVPWLNLASVSVTPTSLEEQLFVLPKSAAMVLSWFLAYESVKRLPISLSGAVRASGPLWTLAAGMIVLGEFISALQFLGIVLVIVSYYLFVIIGKKENIFEKEPLGLAMMLAATLLAGGVTVYDKFLIQVRHQNAFNIQAWSAVHRFILAGMLVIVFQRGTHGLRINNWRFSIVLLGCSWVVAELFYFVAVLAPEAKVTILAVLRRAALVVSFMMSALLLGERFVFSKTIMLSLLVAGIVITLIG
ncbi:MAG: DMT family transporter [Pseudomonadota bacterium]